MGVKAGIPFGRVAPGKERMNIKSEIRKWWGARQCRAGRHDPCIAGDIASGMYGYCMRCGITSPRVPFASGSWAIDLINDAVRDGTAFKGIITGRKG